MHFIGAEMFHVKSVFKLKKNNNKIYFNASIENHAILPPPLNGITEKFMAAKSKKELDSFIENIELTY